ncbi:MAG TPA: FAD-binding oxidoreductase [Myxococcales bacterium]|nr:FAD-binding oxidoreductase [Myxococcales bacterium]
MADPGADRRSFWGWGLESAGPDAAQQDGIRKTMEQRLGASLELAAAPELDDLALPQSRIAPPDALASRCSTGPYDRAGHSYGKSYRDVVRGARGDFSSPPDFVAFPQDEGDVAALLDWATDAQVIVIPYGGGSSVVGGVECLLEGDYRGVVSMDLTRLDRVLEIDRASRAARIQAGILGPALENALRPHGLTLRHFPQSFEFSTLGGWIATRSGGHYATLYTHIDDFVEGMRVITPSGPVESRRLPGSGAGPSPDRLFLGSEGSLGVITEAWMRLQDRPTHRASATIRFVGADGFLRGAEAVRALSQSGLAPTNCRLLDSGEALQSGAGRGDESVLVLGFESADHGLQAWMDRALEICGDAGGLLPEDGAQIQHQAKASGAGGAQREGAAGAWRNAFLQAPYVRDVLVRMAVICETFETAVTWDRFPEFHREVTAAVQNAIGRVCGSGTVNCRFTHAYPDGAAPYYSVMAPGRRGSELEQWAEIKAAASEALIAHGGTITHHHAVGRDHRPWYDVQRPDLFGRALDAAKRELDPGHILNPGVIID